MQSKPAKDEVIFNDQSADGKVDVPMYTFAHAVHVIFLMIQTLTFLVLNNLRKEQRL